MAAPLMKGLLNLLASKNSLEVAKSALPGAAVNAVVGGIAAGPAGALGYGLGDFLLNYPLMRVARKISPATAELVTNLKTKKTTERLSPSALEQGANLTASLLSPLATDLVTGGALLLQPGRNKQFPQTKANRHKFYKHYARGRCLTMCLLRPCLYLQALCFKQVVLIKEHFIIQA
jgi:hypothetical protein